VTDDSFRTESLAVVTASHASGKRRLQRLSPAEAALLRYEWRFWARPSQIAPAGEWGIWLLMTGRGFGKTRAGAQWVIEQAKSPGHRIAIVGRIPADGRDVMVGGESGILACSAPDFRPAYTPSQRLLRWSNGSEAKLYSSEKPEDLRGPNFHCAWIDELAKYDRAQETWDTLVMAVRLPTDPRIVVTTTPRPISIIKTLMDDPACRVTHGSIYDNRSNLSGKFFERLVKRYEGTYLGQQELEGLLITDRPGALWTREVIDTHRVRAAPDILTRVVVAIDPPATASQDSSEAGIVVVGQGIDGCAYVLADGSLHGSPDTWGRQAVRLYDRFNADQIIGEVNNGGDMVGFTVKQCAEALRRDGERDSSVVPYVAVRASRGKLTRAEPVSALYTQGRVRHVGLYADLEDQLTSWVPGEASPDRLDALVWALTSLVIYGSTDVETWGGAETPEQSEYVREVATRDGVWFPPSAGVH
jgi:phage terminase large subunit-like protein